MPHKQPRTLAETREYLKTHISQIFDYFHSVATKRKVNESVTSAVKPPRSLAERQDVNKKGVIKFPCNSISY